MRPRKSDVVGCRRRFDAEKAFSDGRLPQLVLAFGSVAWAETIVPQSALIPSTTYYTGFDRWGHWGSADHDGWRSQSPTSGGSRNDDGFSGPINLGFTLNFFGNNYTQFWANNNGNISFGAGIDAFTPMGPIGAAQAVISPFFADVDTRNLASGVMNLRTDIPNQIIVTWDMVGYYDQHADLLNSFQLVLRGPAYPIPAGEGAHRVLLQVDAMGNRGCQRW